jgi:hypothetical protein
VGIHQVFVHGVILLAFAVGSSASAADVKPVAVDDISKIEYRISLPGQEPLVQRFVTLNMGFAAATDGNPFDAGKSFKLSELSPPFRQAAIQARADVDGNGSLSTPEATRLAIILLGRKAVAQNADAAAIALYIDGKPVEGGIDLTNKQQSIGLRKLIEHSKHAYLVGPLIAEMDATLENSTGIKGGY